MQEAAHEIQENSFANQRAREATIEEQIAALPSYLREAILAQKEASQPSLSAEDAAIKRRLADNEIQREGTEFGEYEANASLEDRYRNKRRMIPGVDGSRELMDPAVDKYSPCRTTSDWESEEAVKRFNHVGPGRMVIHVPRPELYKEITGDRVDEICYDIPDAHVVTRKSDGKPLYSRDAVFISIPKIYGDVHSRVGREERLAWDAEIKAGTQHGSIIPRTAPPELVAEAKQVISEAARQRSEALGIGSQYHSPTGGMDLMVAERMFTTQEIQNMEANARAGGRHRSSDEIREINAAASKGKKTFGGLQGNPKYNKFEASKDRAAAAR